MSDDIKKRGRPPKDVAPLQTGGIISSVSREPLTDAIEFVTHYATHRAMGRRPRFANKDFNGLRIVGHELPAADFVGCNFNGAQFESCNLQGCLIDDKCEGWPVLESCDTRFGSFENNRSLNAR